MAFTHRTSHGTHGAGYDTTLHKEGAQTLEALKKSHASVFSEPTYPVERDKLFQHEIQLKDPAADPPRRKIYPLDAVESAALREQL